MENYQNTCFISVIAEALSLNKKFKEYALEKENAKVRFRNDNKDVDERRDKYRESWKSYHETGSSFKRKKFVDSFLVEDTIHNIILKSIIGFIGGMLLTYLCFMFLVFSLNFTLKRATYICIALGVILSLGLAFSVKIRCTVFLCIPQLFSKRGRQALLAYAFILALSGPAKNTLHNVEVLSESLACGQEQIKQAENELLKCVHKPNAAAKKSIEKLLDKINNSVKFFKNFILQFYRTFYNLAKTFSHGQKWLYSISSLCNEKFGNPVQRCRKSLIECSLNCQEAKQTLEWKNSCLLHPSELNFICPSCGNYICSPQDIQQYLSVPDIQRKLQTFKRRAMNILYVRVGIHQTYTQSNRTNTFHEEFQGMATEIRQKTDQFLQYFDFMSVIFGIFILVVFVKVVIYRHKFLTQDHYDNRFITQDFEDIDNTRAEFNLQTLLPLKHSERTKYIKVTSLRLVPCERVRLLSSFIFLIFATFKIIIHMLTDSSLYWILSMVRHEERSLYMSSLKEEEPAVVVRVLGSGIAADLFRNVSEVVRQQYSTQRLDPTPCLPDPIAPDYNRYYQILALVIICWLLALFEPYGLRFRHSVMVTYHPDRARERAIWLYNKIITQRNSYVKSARREIRRKFKHAHNEPILRFEFIENRKSLKCLLCKLKIRSNVNHVKCKSKNCIGIYCQDCFEMLKCCSICTNPAEYGDLSDVSEEKDSSDDENTSSNDVYNAESSLKSDNFITGKSYDEKSNTVDFIERWNENLLQPTLLLQAVKYCRSKIFNLQKNLASSDYESSEWDSCISSEISENQKTRLLKFQFDERKKRPDDFRKKTKPDDSRKKPLMNENRANKIPCESLNSESEESFRATCKRKKSSDKANKRPVPDFLFKTNIKNPVEEKLALNVKDSTEMQNKYRNKALAKIHGTKSGRREDRWQNKMVNTSPKSFTNEETQTGDEYTAKMSVIQFADISYDGGFDRPSTSKDWPRGDEFDIPEQALEGKVNRGALMKPPSEKTRYLTYRKKVCKQVTFQANESSDSYNENVGLCWRGVMETSMESDDADFFSDHPFTLADVKESVAAIPKFKVPVPINVLDNASVHENTLPKKVGPEEHALSKMEETDKSSNNVETKKSKRTRFENVQEKLTVKAVCDMTLESKSSKLSWAPDLLSDLPSSKNEDSKTSSDEY